MKKIMIALASVAFLTNLHAASVNWKTGLAVKAPTSASDGTFGSSNAGAETLSLYVWIVDATTYNNATYDSIAKMDVNTATVSATKKSGAAGANAAWEYTGDDWSDKAETTIYGLILTTYKSGDIDMYIANKATTIINTAGKADAVTNLAKNYGGTGGTAITGWTSASTEPVPEPTSAMLLMLGLCGLALKRKNA